MSILEIILYSILGVAFIGWIIATIVKYKKGKDNNEDED